MVSVIGCPVPVIAHHAVRLIVKLPTHPFVPVGSPLSVVYAALEATVPGTENSSGAAPPNASAPVAAEAGAASTSATASTATVAGSARIVRRACPGGRSARRARSTAARARLR